MVLFLGIFSGIVLFFWGGMRLLIAVAILFLYLILIPNLFIELTESLYPLNEVEIRHCEFIVMLSGVIAFVTLTPIEWFKKR